MNSVAHAASGSLGFTKAFLNFDEISDGTIDCTHGDLSGAAISSLPLLCRIAFGEFAVQSYANSLLDCQLE